MLELHKKLLLSLKVLCRFEIDFEEVGHKKLLRSLKVLCRFEIDFAIRLGNIHCFY